MTEGLIFASRRRRPIAFALRHPVAVALVLASLTAKPETPDDRRLLLANPATNTDVPGRAGETAPAFFTSPALPAFASASGDEGVIGSVIPSHRYPAVGPGPAAASSWTVWNGSLKAYKLDNHGHIPTVAVSRGFPDESNPDDADPALRRPVWNAARVLGYTNPVTTMIGGQATMNPVGAVSVWPGRKMVWADDPLPGQPAVPLRRQDFSVPPGNAPPGTCGTAGNCFVDLMKAMGLEPDRPGDATKAIQTVQFLRGGKTPAGSRDEILNALGAYGSVAPGSKYSYIYQDDGPGGNASRADTPAYPHKLGDIFHSEPTMLLPPKRFPFLSMNVNPRAGACGLLPDCSYASFARLHRYRRKTVFVGSNDGFLHAFDAGVWDRDTHFPKAFDLGTGQEIFAYAPKGVMKPKFPSLLRFPPEAQYLTDGSPALGDVFIGPTDSLGAAVASSRTWKTILVCGLRQGGRHYFALDVTQPDQVRTDVPPTDIRYGAKVKDKKTSPDCLDGEEGCAAPYPTVLWEMTDDCAINGATCVSNMGRTWSRPVVGRIKVINGSGATEDRYVAIFGGGFDPDFSPGTQVVAGDRTSGRAFYIVDVERGRIIYKATSGKDDSGHSVLFAPMPAAPAVADVDDDGYLDFAYIGDLNGRMWKIDLRPDSGSRRGACSGCGSVSETLIGYQPFLFYDATTLEGTTSSSHPIHPIFLEAGIIFISGGPSPTLGIAFGTGDRAELIEPGLRVIKNTSTQVRYVNRFYFVKDSGVGRTLHEEDLNNVTPSDGIDPGSGPVDAANTPNGYFLNFGSSDEKAVSTVFATQGILTLVTFSPGGADGCSKAGESFRYRLFFLTGQGAINGLLSPFGNEGEMAQYREKLGPGLAGGTQSQSPNGDLIDAVIFWNGQINQQNTSFLKTNSESWKEQ